jgi:hypothetical protein
MSKSVKYVVATIYSTLAVCFRSIVKLDLKQYDLAEKIAILFNSFNWVVCIGNLN